MKNYKKVILTAVSLLLTASVLVPAESPEIFQMITSHSQDSNEIEIDGMVFISYYDNELYLKSYVGDGGDIVVPETVEGYTVTGILEGVFMYNKNIKAVSLPDTIDYFGSRIFFDSSVTSVNIPKNLHIIPYSSFSGCKKLKTVTFHDNILAIDGSAFGGTNISIPDKLRNKISNSYIEDSNQQDYTFDSNEWRGEVWESGNGSSYAYLTGYNGYATDIIVPDEFDGAKVIHWNYMHATDEFPQVKSIVFPKIKTELRISFSDTGLEEITLPDITEISGSVFKNCTDLKKVNFQGSCEKFIIDAEAFTNCTSLDYLPMPDGCKHIDIKTSAFENTNIADVSIDCSSSIGGSAFRNCQSLTSVELNNSDVSAYAFRKCESLKNVTISGNSYLGNLSFSDCENLENVTFSGSDITSDNPFNDCPLLMNINSKPAFDSATGDFNSETKEIILEHFNSSNEVGFINLYVQAQVEKIISENITDDMTEMQKIKVIHDWVCNNTVYDSDNVGERKNHNDASILMNESTVCEGYARMCNLLYNEAGIETYYVNNSNHAWNIVKLGSHYFHVDSTWDDGEEISYDWFLKSDDELSERDKWRLYKPSSLHSFQKESLPVCEYRMGDVNTDGAITVADLVMTSKYILGQTSMSTDDYILSDLTFDGNTDVFDLILMRKLIVNS